MTVTWIPLPEYGETFYWCRVEMYGHIVEAVSRRKADAFSFALEKLAALVIQTQVPTP